MSFPNDFINLNDVDDHQILNFDRNNYFNIEKYNKSKKEKSYPIPEDYYENTFYGKTYNSFVSPNDKSPNFKQTNNFSKELPHTNALNYSYNYINKLKNKEKNKKDKNNNNNQYIQMNDSLYDSNKKNSFNNQDKVNNQNKFANQNIYNNNKHNFNFKPFIKRYEHNNTKKTNFFESDEHLNFYKNMYKDLSDESKDLQNSFLLHNQDANQNIINSSKKDVNFFENVL